MKQAYVGCCLVLCLRPDPAGHHARSALGYRTYTAIHREMSSMNALRRVWDHFEEGFIAFLLGAMTLVTFVYVILNNAYTLFYNLADRFPAAEDFFFAIGGFIIGLEQAMTWSNALTKALFGWLIFFGVAYGVRTAGHIGVDALVKLAPRHVQRIIGLIACVVCLG